MATKKISALTGIAQDSIDPAVDVLPIVDTGSTETKKATAAAIVGRAVNALAATWNDALTTFTAIKYNITDTASAAASKLIDLQTGGTTQFNVDKSGNTFIRGVTKFGVTGTGTSGVVSVGGGNPAAFEKLSINALLPSSGGISIGLSNAGTCPSSTTTSYSIYATFATTQNAAFTLAGLTHYSASENAITGGSRTPPTVQTGFEASSNMTGAVTNFGFLGGIPAGANRWNFFASGTAANHFTGATTFGTSLGYGVTSGVGGTVTQATNKSTGVTLDKICGEIVMNNAQLNRDTAVSFTLTNSKIDLSDVIIVNIKSGATVNAYNVGVTAVASGSCRIQLHNILGGTDLSEAVVLSFAVIKAVTV